MATSTTTTEPATPGKPLTKWQIAGVWLPLAFSWLLMTFEGPWIQAVIGRQPDAQNQLAAFGLVMSLSILIESPVIMLLATGSALAKHRQAYQVLRRYMLLLNIGVTVVAFLMGFTPLLDIWLGDVIGIPPALIDDVRPGMQIMVFWSALIGYRRFYQGIMIRYNHTRAIGYGTGIRIVASALVAVLLGFFTALPGAVIGAWALMAAVFTEALYTIYASLEDVQHLQQQEPPPDATMLSLLDVSRFHLPLAVTSLVTLLIRPLMEWVLALAPDAGRTLAAWSVIYSIILLMRSGALAWQEVVISLNTTPQARQQLREFTLWLGVGLSGLMTLFAWTPLIHIYLKVVLSVPESLQPLIILGTGVACLLPLLTAFQSDFRALLMCRNTTAPIYQAMLVSVVGTVVVALAGLQLEIPVIMLPAFGLTAGLVLEIVYLYVAQRL
jgi:hypothetical protein